MNIKNYKRNKDKDKKQQIIKDKDQNKGAKLKHLIS